jgi:hypothetical protein
MKHLVYVALMFLLLGNCNKTHRVIHSFCYWKTTSNNNIEENNYLLSQLKVKHMYVRFFDVDWNPYAKAAQPIASLNTIDFDVNTLNITPSIFITNDVILMSSQSQLDTLAKKITMRCADMVSNFELAKAQRKSNEITNADYAKTTIYNRLNEDSILNIEIPKSKLIINELLIDCDWTEKSKDNYFYFLKQLQRSNNYIKIAATIRLWQYKHYKKAGIPPVTKGLLMCYNMESVNQHSTENSIASSKELTQYITHDSYALNLDIALPLFSWSLAFSGNTFKGILPENINLSTDSLILKKIAPNRYVLQDDMMMGNNYLRSGDEIRIEKVSDNELKNMITIIKKNIPMDNNTKITFFSFDNNYITNYGIKNINNYYALF